MKLFKVAGVVLLALVSCSGRGLQIPDAPTPRQCRGFELNLAINIHGQLPAWGDVDNLSRVVDVYMSNQFPNYKENRKVITLEMARMNAKARRYLGYDILRGPFEYRGSPEEDHSSRFTMNRGGGRVLIRWFDSIEKPDTTGFPNGFPEGTSAATRGSMGLMTFLSEPSLDIERGVFEHEMFHVFGFDHAIDPSIPLYFHRSFPAALRMSAELTNMPIFISAEWGMEADYLNLECLGVQIEKEKLAYLASQEG